jgi:hypothetical protein
MRHKSVFVRIIAVAALFAAGSAWAGDGSSFFAAPVISYIWVNGDFDGTRTVSGGGETMVIPAVTPGLGYGGTVGLKMPFFESGDFSAALEAQCMFAPLSGMFALAPYDVLYFNLEGIMTVFYSLFDPISVYAKAGFGYTWITVVNGASNGTATGNFVINGGEMGGGVGVSIDIFGIAELRIGVSVHLSDIVTGSGIAVSGSMDAVDDSPFMAEASLLIKLGMD